MTNMLDSSSWDLSAMLSELPHTWNAPMEPQRTPLFVVPPIALSQTLSTPELEFYFFKIAFWLELLLIFAGMLLLGIFWGCVLYHYCIKPERQFTTTSYLVAYGIVLPFWLAFPATTSHLLGIRNKIMRFTLTTCVSSICAFRTTAAVHGFSPPHATRSARDFVFYYAAPARAQFDPKTETYVRNTLSTRLGSHRRFLGKLFLAGMMSSIFQMYPETFTPLAKSPTTVWYDWYAILHFQNLKDNLLMAAFFQVYLCTFYDAMIAIQSSLTRIEPEEAMNNPVFESTSPSEFWGRRWNLLIHDCLKRGVFLPVRRNGGSVTMAVMASFAASGVFHEWIQLTVFPTWDHRVEDDKCYLVGYDEPVSAWHCYKPQWGASLAFFMWQAVLIAVEFAVGPYCKRFFLQVPAPVKTALTILAGGCVAHWFTEPYLHSNFFLDGSPPLFMIKRVEG